MLEHFFLLLEFKFKFEFYFELNPFSNNPKPKFLNPILPNLPNLAQKAAAAKPVQLRASLATQQQ
jgi:hypothetical protein